MIHEGIITFPNIMKVVIYANMAYILLKLLLIVLHFFGWIDLWQVMNYLGFRFMRMPITGSWERLQTSVDILTPFLLFFFLAASRLGVVFSKGFRQVYVSLAILSTLVSFSRYLIFVCMCSLLIYSFMLSFNKRLKQWMAVIALLISTFFLLGSDTVQGIIYQRVSSVDVLNSDSVRVQQIEALFKAYEPVALFGNGLGAYAKDNIRDPLLPYYYEVQWMAFLMQFGLIGLLLLFIPLGWVSYRFCLAPFSREKGCFLMLFLLWILSGFTNPFLISLTSGIIYTLFLLSSQRIVTNTAIGYNQGL